MDMGDALYMLLFGGGLVFLVAAAFFAGTFF